MGMSTHVYGIKPPDKKWLKMKAVFDACKEAGIEAPDEVWEYFQGEEPDPDGVLIDLDRAPAVTEYSTYSTSGLEVDIRQLPKDIRVIRFVNSY